MCSDKISKAEQATLRDRIVAHSSPSRRPLPSRTPFLSGPSLGESELGAAVAFKTPWAYKHYPKG